MLSLWVVLERDSKGPAWESLFTQLELSYSVED